MMKSCGLICFIFAIVFYLISLTTIDSEEDEFLKSATRIYKLKDLESKVFPLIIAVSGRVGSETPLKCDGSDVPGVILEESVEQEFMKRNWKFQWVQESVSMDPVSKEVPWYLDDGTGRVNVTGARNATGLVLTFGSDVFEKAEPPSFFQRIVDNLRGLKMLGVRRVEHVLEIGTQLTVVGEAVKDGIGNVKIQKPEGGLFYVTPIPFDQLFSDPGEWPWCFKFVSIGLAILGVILISFDGIVYSIEKTIETTTHILERRQRQRERQQQREREQEREREREREREQQRELEQEIREWDRQRQWELQQDWEEVQEWEREQEREKERERERLLQNSHRVAIVVEEASKRPEPEVTRDLESQDENSDDLCVVCYEEKYNVVFVPCRHFCCCITCSSKLKICPLCRRQIKFKVLKIYRH